MAAVPLEETMTTEDFKIIYVRSNKVNAKLVFHPLTIQTEGVNA